MTALAFLFAVFLARPCPFYILDEVEAALDDLNIDRFLKLLRSFSDRAQFIVVTHQKRTMEAADTLYGVSMAGNGVSKVISRRLPPRGRRGQRRAGRADRSRPSRARERRVGVREPPAASSSSASPPIGIGECRCSGPIEACGRVGVAGVRERRVVRAGVWQRRDELGAARRSSRRRRQPASGERSVRIARARARPSALTHRVGGSAERRARRLRRAASAA